MIEKIGTPAEESGGAVAQRAAHIKPNKKKNAKI